MKIVKKANFPTIRVSPKFRIVTEKMAELEQENISEYIRKAIEMRNERVYQSVIDKAR